MRIVYGIPGEGRGHVTRMLTLIAEIDAEFLILAGNDSYHYIKHNLNDKFKHKTIQIPALKYSYKGGQVNLLKSVFSNLPKVIDFKSHYLNVKLGMMVNTETSRIQKVVDDFKPDLIISDSEYVNHLRRDVPLVIIDNYSKIAFCEFDLKVSKSYMWKRNYNAKVYKSTVGNPDDIIATSFYNAPPLSAFKENVFSTGPIYRNDVLALEPSEGDHVIVYVTNPAIYVEKFLDALKGLDRRVFIYGHTKVGIEANLIFKTFNNIEFIKDLASCVYSITTPGSMLLSEILYFKKRGLLLKSKSLEQQENALFAEKMGFAQRIDANDISSEEIESTISCCKKPLGLEDHKFEILNRLQKFL